MFNDLAIQWVPAHRVDLVGKAREGEGDGDGDGEDWTGVDAEAEEKGRPGEELI